MAVFICGFFNMQIDQSLTAASLAKAAGRVFEVAAPKIRRIEKRWNPSQGTPVFTRDGKYTSRGWTEWTQGFQFGSALLQFDATGENEFLESGRRNTVERMASHVSHFGVHDHGFNNVSTYGNLWRLMREGKIPHNEQENDFYELALKVSGAVQAARWTEIEDGGDRLKAELHAEPGFIYSFNGPHSLFIDTMRSLRSLAVAHQLGHALMGECDRKISLLDRLIEHGKTTAKFAVYYGDGRDAYDVCGRTAHESIFNTNDGKYRCPNSQQGYSPFTTWSRGLAWAICGFAEQIEFLKTQPGVAEETLEIFTKAALATADLYIEESCADGIPMWDFGAPNLHRLGDYKSKPADPFNEWEPVDSSAAAIAAQGLIRIGEPRYVAAGLTIARNLFAAPYLSEDEEHEGLILHSIYHRPNGWDQIHAGQKVPNGESSMWGDYHALELALLIQRMHQGKYLNFYDAKTDARSNAQNAR
jgi:unsaturated chondroitin disaccharide hydrolase